MTATVIPTMIATRINFHYDLYMLIAIVRFCIEVSSPHIEDNESRDCIEFAVGHWVLE